MIAWQPSASIACLRERAQCLADIRDFFNSRGYLEVETPVMARFGVTDIYLQNILATFTCTGLTGTEALEEFPLPELLVATIVNV